MRMTCDKTGSRRKRDISEAAEFDYFNNYYMKLCNSDETRR